MNNNIPLLLRVLKCRTESPVTIKHYLLRPRCSTPLTLIHCMHIPFLTFPEKPPSTEDIEMNSFSPDINTPHPTPTHPKGASLASRDQVDGDPLGVAAGINPSSPVSKNPGVASSARKFWPIKSDSTILGHSVPSAVEETVDQASPTRMDVGGDFAQSNTSANSQVPQDQPQAASITKEPVGQDTPTRMDVGADFPQSDNTLSSSQPQEQAQVASIAEEAVGRDTSMRMDVRADFDQGNNAESPQYQTQAASSAEDSDVPNSRSQEQRDTTTGRNFTTRTDNVSSSSQSPEEQTQAGLVVEETLGQGTTAGMDVRADFNQGNNAKSPQDQRQAASGLPKPKPSQQSSKPKESRVHEPEATGSTVSVES